MTNLSSPPKLVADLVIREEPGDVLHFETIDPEIAERMQVEFGAGEFGIFGIHEEAHKNSQASGYLHIPWPFDYRKLARYMGEVAKCKYLLEFRIETFRSQEYEIIKGDSSE